MMGIKVKITKNEAIPRRDFLAAVGIGALSLTSIAKGLSSPKREKPVETPKIVRPSYSEVVEINRDIEEEALGYQKQQLKCEKFYERGSPGEIPLSEGSDTLELARLLLGEAEGENEEYLGWVGDSVLTRHERNGKNLKSVIYDTTCKKRGDDVIHQYSCFNEFDPNHAKVVDPLSCVDESTWSAMYDFAEKAIARGPRHKVTHYWVDKVKKPTWATEGNFVNSIKSKGHTTRFHYLGNYRTSVIVSSRV